MFCALDISTGRRSKREKQDRSVRIVKMEEFNTLGLMRDTILNKERLQNETQSRGSRILPSNSLL
jgi:hypothetical protein